MNVLSLTYLGNVQYYTKLCFSDCVIDIHENYLKQSYRTRCDILSANGTDSLIVNVIKGSNIDKLKVKDVRIDYSKRWEHQHWHAIVSAYRNSPYFDYYAHLFEPFYRKRYDFLLDFNTELMNTVLSLLGVDRKINFSDKYIDPDDSASNIIDYRDTISPKPRLAKPDPYFTPEPYWQVFSDRMPFTPNLSIIDLLFCEGPSTIDVLRSSSLLQPTE